MLRVWRRLTGGDLVQEHRLPLSLDALESVVRGFRERVLVWREDSPGRGQRGSVAVRGTHHGSVCRLRHLRPGVGGEVGVGALSPVEVVVLDDYHPAQLVLGHLVAGGDGGPVGVREEGRAGSGSVLAGLEDVVDVVVVEGGGGGERPAGGGLVARLGRIYLKLEICWRFVAWFGRSGSGRSEERVESDDAPEEAGLDGPDPGQLAREEAQQVKVGFRFRRNYRDDWTEGNYGR